MSENDRVAFVKGLWQMINESESVYATADKRLLHSVRFLFDEKRKDCIGKTVFTVENNGKALNIIDLDLTLNSESAIPIRFLERLPLSSEANEYYNAETIEQRRGFQLETVNRHTLPFDIEGTVQNVYVSAFPFKLNVYDDMDELNAELGFAKGVRVGKTDLIVHGYSPMFLGSGESLGNTEEADEPFSFVIGNVKSFREVSVRFVDYAVRFYIIYLETALGLLPVAANDEYFDLRKLNEGKVVAMFAAIKADFVKDRYPAVK